MNRYLVIGLLLTSVPMASVQAREPSLDERLQRIERILENQSLSDLVLQIQRLRQEMQQLRGELEVQGHTIEALKTQQRELYLDLDRRLSAGEASAAGTPEGEAVPSETPPREPAVPAAPAPVAEPITAPPPAPEDSGAEQEEYQRAFDLLREGNYPDSISAFRSFLQRYPSSDLAGNAQYWLGEASYVTRDFDTAMSDFNRVIERYPESSKVPSALLKVGFIHYEQRAWGKAREVLGRLQSEYAGTTEARLAQQRLDRMRSEGR
jgi:tol-pal system protein YbgF